MLNREPRPEILTLPSVSLGYVLRILKQVTNRVLASAPAPVETYLPQTGKEPGPH